MRCRGGRPHPLNREGRFRGSRAVFPWFTGRLGEILWGMKRTVVAIALAGTCLAAGVALWHHHRAENRYFAAAQLLPAETLLLADFPDLPATAIRWRETALCEIFNEPQVQVFLAKPLAKLQEKGIQSSLAQIQPKRAFLAVTSVTNNMPRAVGGFSFGGDRAEVEKLVVKARVRAQRASPHGKFERLSYGTFQIESFSDNGITLAGCFAKNWYFVANDIDLLKTTLDRFTGKTLTALALAPTYQQSQAVLPLHPDFRLFAQPGVLSDRLLARLNASGRTVDLQESVALRKIRAVALATRLEGRRIRDTLFLYQPETTPRPILNGKTLALTTPNTLFYAAMAPLISDEVPQRGDPRVVPGIIPMRILLAALNPPPATLLQFKTAFGPEHAVLLDWPSGVAQPNLFLACEIRDPAEARRFMESVFHAWSRADAEGVSFWTLTMDDPTMAQFHPTVALTAHHLLVGLSPESLKPFASNAIHPPTEGATLEQSSAFQGVMASLPKPQTGIAYLDAKPLFERVYGWLRPAAMLWGNGIAGFGGWVDFCKIPTTTVIAEHLSPIGLSATQTDSGILFESTGPVSFLELGAGVGTATLLVAMPAIREKPSLPRKGAPGIIPPNPATPLAAPSFTTPGIPTSSQSAATPEGSQ